MIHVHQFHQSARLGDAIGNDMVEIRTILRDSGYSSEIFSRDIDPKMEGVRDYRDYKMFSSSENILLLHYSIGLGPELLNFIKSLPDKKILIYHNITPPQFFQGIDSTMEYYTMMGLEELKQLRGIVEIALGDSEYNRKELEKLGFRESYILPIFVDLEKYNVLADKKIIDKYGDDQVNILFVGRIAPNKKIEDVIKSFYCYKKYINGQSRLLLVGDYSIESSYYQDLKSLIERLGIKDVNFAGHVSFEELVAYYRSADIFITMSEHEGFCVPLIESMYFDIPIVAYNSTAVPLTLGGSGILINEKNYPEIAEVLNLLIENQELRQKVIKKQRERLKDFNRDNSKEILIKHIQDLLSKEQMLNIRVEGTFEDSYSLSIVNRNLALALDRAGCNVSLFATTGSGNYTPDESKIVDPKVRSLWLNQMDKPEFTIRNIYPPRVNDMNGRYNLINFYWEESLIPNIWVWDFNKLDGIIVASSFIKKVLMDSGVTAKIAIIHPGIDMQFSYNNVEPAKLNTDKSFVFLNISSGFPRKGLDLLLKAYLKEFSREDSVCLVIKTFPNIHNNIESMIRSYKKANSPQIIHIDEDIENWEIAALYKRCDCFVAPTRGEGFGLPMAEAMLFKKPVIVTNYGGHLEFCNQETAYLIDYRLRPSMTHLRKDYGLNGSMWAEAEVNHLRKLMRYIYENKDCEEIRDKVNAAYNNIINNFTWDKSAEKTIALLESLRSKVRVGIISTWNTRCGIAEYTRYLITANSNKLQFAILANRLSQDKTIGKDELTRRDEANVVRCWNMGSNDLNDLFDNIKRMDLDIVHVQYNFGFFKLSVLFELLERLRCEGIKTIVTFHATLRFQNAMDVQIETDQLKGGLNAIDRIWVHTDKDVENLSSIGVSENVIHIPQGMRAFMDRDKSSVRKGLFTRSKIISTFGFLLPPKGVIETIRSLRLLKNIYPDILYLVVCSLYPAGISREYFEACKRETEELGLKNNIVFITDFLDDKEIIELIQASDIVTMPYQETKESSSAAVRFALACCRPVLVTENHIFDEFSSCVHRIPECSPEAIAKGIIDLYTDEALQNKITKAAKAMVEDMRWENVSEKYESLILELSAPRCSQPSVILQAISDSKEIETSM